MIECVRTNFKFNVYYYYLQNVASRLADKRRDGGVLKLTGAVCRQADGSRTDGKKLFQLPFPVMPFDVNLSAINHPEVTSDADRSTRLFLTDYCKALSNAFDCKCDFHNMN